jgi:uncharacterized protein Usg
MMTVTRQRLLAYRLTTAQITYHLPDYPGVLQNFIWQDLDLFPQLPVLRKFLDFWHRNLEGRLHSVEVATANLVRPAEFRFARGEWILQ